MKDRAFSVIIKFYALQVSIKVTCLKIAANLDNLDRGKIPIKVLEENQKSGEVLLLDFIISVPEFLFYLKNTKTGPIDSEIYTRMMAWRSHHRHTQEKNLNLYQNVNE